MGIFRPLILLPAAALAGWEPQQLEMVLLHELAHVRRFDNLVNLLQRLVESLLFFHPMVWIVSGWVRREREHCCDDVVVARTQQPRAYAEILIHFADQVPTSPFALARTVSSMAERSLVARIRCIMKKEEQAMQVSRKTVGLMFAGLLALVMIGGYCSLKTHAEDTSASAAESQGKSDPATPKTNAAQPADEVSPASDQSATKDGIVNAKSVTWRTTYYKHITSKDGKRTWLKTETRPNAYKAPGLYRETFLDENGQVRKVDIIDEVHKKRLTFVPEAKEATFFELGTNWDPGGPFDWVKKELNDRNLQWVETRKTPAGEVNVFRHAFRDEANGRDWSYDFWINQGTKQLVEVHCPGADIYDPDKDPARNTPPEKNWSTGTVPGSIYHDIVFNTDLDDSLFRLKPPQGYTVKTQRPGQVTETEMIDYLGVLADFNDKTFPDHVFPFDISYDRVNRAEDKPKKDRTAVEQKLVETKDYYTFKFYRMPTSVFVEDHTAASSFRYLGKGVKLGDKGRIVCWYKLKDAKDPNMYRAVYGDLSVKDVAPEDSPLPVENDKTSAAKPADEAPPANGQPLSTALKAYNQEAARLGVKEPPLTEEEVIAATRGWNRTEQKVDDETYAVFQRIADSKSLPAQAKLVFRPSRTYKGSDYIEWSVALTLNSRYGGENFARGGDRYTYFFPIHGRLIRNDRPGVLDLASSHATDADLERHLKGRKNLTELWLGLTDITDAGLAQLKGITSLKLLTLDGDIHITDAGLEHLKGLENLERLDIEASYITDAGLAHLKSLTKLRHLSIRSMMNGTTRVSDNGLAYLEAMKKLEGLDLVSIPITDAGLPHLQGLTNLQSLRLRKTKVTHEGVKKLQQALPHCKINRAADSAAATPQANDQSNKPSNAEPTDEVSPASDQSGTKAGAKTELKPAPAHGSTAEPNTEQAKAIAEIEKLGGSVIVSEEIPGKPVIEVFLFSKTKDTDAALASLNGLPQVQWLAVNGSNVTDAGLAKLKGLTNLHMLVLDRTQITDAGLEHLKALSQLQDVSLDGTKVTDAGLEHLKGLTNLQSLDIAETKVTDAGLTHLEPLRQLKELYLGSERITDAGLSHLESLHELEELVLVGDRITDAGLVHLQSLRKLKTLKLQCSISDVGMKHLLPLTNLTKLVSLGSPNDPVKKKIFSTLREPTTIEFIDTPLCDVCAYLQELHGIKFEIDETALKDAKTDKFRWVNHNIKGIQLRAALNSLLDPLGLAWRVAPGGVVVTTKAAYAKRHANLLQLQRTAPNLKQVEVDW